MEVVHFVIQQGKKLKCLRALCMLHLLPETSSHTSHCVVMVMIQDVDRRAVR